MPRERVDANEEGAHSDTIGILGYREIWSNRQGEGDAAPDDIIIRINVEGILRADGPEVKISLLPEKSPVWRQKDTGRQRTRAFLCSKRTGRRRECHGGGPVKRLWQEGRCLPYASLPFLSFPLFLFRLLGLSLLFFLRQFCLSSHPPLFSSFLLSFLYSPLPFLFLSPSYDFSSNLPLFLSFLLILLSLSAFITPVVLICSSVASSPICIVRPHNFHNRPSLEKKDQQYSA